MKNNMNQKLTLESAKPGLQIVCTAHPEWGTWTLKQDERGAWSKTGRAGTNAIDAGEFHFWAVVAPAGCSPAFAKWLNTFIDEKGIDREFVLEVAGKSGPNFIPVSCLLAAILDASPLDQADIKAAIVRIDFANGDVIRFFKHIAQAIAL